MMFDVLSCFTYFGHKRSCWSHIILRNLLLSLSLLSLTYRHPDALLCEFTCKLIIISLYFFPCLAPWANKNRRFPHRETPSGAVQHKGVEVMRLWVWLTNCARRAEVICGDCDQWSEQLFFCFRSAPFQLFGLL